MFRILWYEEFVFLHLFIYSIIYSYQYGLIYFLLWVSFQYYIILLLKCSSFGHWELFRLSPCPFGIPSSLHCCCYFNTFLLFGTIRCSMLIFYTFYPSLRISYLSEFRFLLLENNIRTEDLSATGVLLLLGPLSWQNKEIQMCEY